MADLQAVLIDGAAPRDPGAAVSVLERGLHYGEGLFETVACLAGKPRLLERHLRRLTSGCERLGLPCDAASIGSEVRALAADSARAIIKVLLMRGPALARGYVLTGRERSVRVALRYAWPEEEPGAAEQGVRVRRARLRLGENPALAGIKHCNRLEQVLARREWSDPGIGEALMFSSSGALVSGTMSNVFLVHGSKLLTPSVDRCGVAGVMRATVLDLAAQLGIPAQERRLDETELAAAEELFLTNALIGIRPISELDGVSVPPGPVTRRLQRELMPYLAVARATGHTGV
jgi:4-amino-4-deoxychorismate lyase